MQHLGWDLRKSLELIYHLRGAQLLWIGSERRVGERLSNSVALLSETLVGIDLRLGSHHHKLLMWDPKPGILNNRLLACKHLPSGVGAWPLH
jgi:hypothetical protein